MSWDQMYLHPSMKTLKERVIQAETGEGVVRWLTIFQAPMSLENKILIRAICQRTHQDFIAPAREEAGKQDRIKTNLGISVR